MERMKKQCHKYCVVQRLCEHDAPAYHAFLFSLLDSLTTSSIYPIQFILTELERFEPQAADSIATVLHFMTLLNQTMLVFDIRSFFQFSSEPPLTIRFVKEAWVDFLRERVTEATIPQLKELCAYMQLPTHIVDHCFVWSQVVYPEKEGSSSSSSS